MQLPHPRDGPIHPRKNNTPTALCVRDVIQIVSSTPHDGPKAPTSHTRLRPDSAPPESNCFYLVLKADWDRCPKPESGSDFAISPGYPRSPAQVPTALLPARRQ